LPTSRCGFTDDKLKAAEQGNARRISIVFLSFDALKKEERFSRNLVKLFK
jgi:hypothetical protein